jgi:hypothetical protein
MNSTVYEKIGEMLSVLKKKRKRVIDFFNIAKVICAD